MKACRTRIQSWRTTGAAIALATVVASVAGAQAAPVPFSTVADSARRAPAPDARIAYGPAAQQFAELRLPTRQAKHPTAILIHGGCWLNAYSLDHVAGIAESLRQQGLAVLTVEYRRVGDQGAGVPGTVQDIRAVYDTLQAIAPRYNLDVSRTLLIGHSAGGQLALWLASEPGVRVQGVVALAAVTDLKEFAAPSGCGSAVPRLMSGSPAEQPARYAVASPVTRQAPNASTRVVLITADGDRIVPQSQADAYRTRFPGTRLERVPGGHFDLVAPWTPAWARVLTIVDELLDSIPR